jgi:CDP-paratose 2-epimerase
MMKAVIITGCNGLIGSESVNFFISKDYRVIGIDNDMRSYFFGNESSTKHIGDSLQEEFDNFTLHNIDIRDYSSLESIFKKESSNIEIIIHTAAQPSHDWASKEPLTDFTINALGTVNLLELFRLNCPKASFIFTSTNKVYGDRPNQLPLIELDKRYECIIDNDLFSIDENMSIDNSKHSIFGASKVSADIFVQEYGKYFNLNTVVFRGGCLTGKNHKGSELHGFLSYLVKCAIKNKKYTIFGYKGKQVRDNIHSSDLVNMFWHFHQNPKCGEIYNAGGGRDNSVSILESIDKINYYSKLNWNNYEISLQERSGDHQWYISDLTKFKNHYPEWSVKISIDQIIKEMVELELKLNNY